MLGYGHSLDAIIGAEYGKKTADLTEISEKTTEGYHLKLRVWKLMQHFYGNLKYEGIQIFDGFGLWLFRLEIYM